MPRTARLILDNAIFHVLNRGNAKQEVFHKEEDFEHFLYILAYYKVQYGFKLYHYCLIPNHFHLQSKIQRAQTLPQAMHDITLTYTTYHHQEYQTVGYLWQGRYKNMLVEEGDYHQRLGGYIERNPVRAGLVKDPRKWKWSSCRFYAFGEPVRLRLTIDGNKKWVDLIDEDPLYKEFGKTPAERQKNYQEFILGIDDEKIRKGLGLREKKFIIGSAAFEAKMGDFFGKRGLKIKARPRGRPWNKN